MILAEKLSLFVALSVTTVALTGCGMTGGMSVAQKPKADLSLHQAVSYSMSHAFPEDAATASNSSGSTASTCHTDRVDQEITFITGLIEFVKTHAPAESHWRTCIVDRLNQRLTDLQTLQTQVQNSASTGQSCRVLMQTIERGHTSPASCEGGPRPAQTCDPAQIENAITGVQNAITSLQGIGTSAGSWLQCPIDILSQRLSGLQSALRQVQDGSASGDCLTVIASVTSHHGARPAACLGASTHTSTPTNTCATGLAIADGRCWTHSTNVPGALINPPSSGTSGSQN